MICDDTLVTVKQFKWCCL